MWCVYYQDGIQALKDVNFTRQPGETVALFGPNGPGKTTFVPQHKGVLRGEGSITIRGLPMTKDNLPKIRSR
ncbi:MAG: ATP-binding cassette domain-containing protein, partial [Terracidiphilus sp.]